ncbi:MAG: hypothetical protein RLZZ293_437 [Pseudomonadota bacterium]|jgi:single-strand DNA-binding protein
MKKIFVTGNVGRDPETRYLTSGEAVVTFSLAVNTGSKDNLKTDWMEVSCFGKTAELVQKWVRKGSKLLIEGTPSANAYINKEGKAVASLRINATNIEFIGGGERTEVAENYSNNHGHQAKNPEDLTPSFTNPGSNFANNQASLAQFNSPGPSNLQKDDIPSAMVHDLKEDDIPF